VEKCGRLATLPRENVSLGHTFRRSSGRLKNGSRVEDAERVEGVLDLVREGHHLRA
jgi:hypothetical protein